MHHSKLTRKERYQIDALIQAGHSQAEIARQLKRSRSTISRELKRNGGRVGVGYDADVAAKRAAKRRWQVGGRRVELSDEQIEWIAERLGWRWSPEQICAQLALVNGGRSPCSHAWIYATLDGLRREGDGLYRNLRRRGKKRAAKGGARGRIPGRVGIEQRPACANDRSEPGHYEIDTIIGKGHHSAVLSIVERTSRRLTLARLDRCCAQEVEEQTVRALRDAPVRSITADNGKEFARHRQIAERLGAPFFFADPYRASQRGTVENANGLVRDFLPKGTDFARVSDQSLRSVEDNINNRPMKLHGWLSRNQAYNRNVALLRSVL